MNLDRSNTASKVVGKPMDRVDGRLKVTGGARYAAEFPLANIAHAVIIGSTIASGRIQNIDTSTAAKSAGVLAILTHLNAPKLETTNPPDLSERWRRVEPVLQSDQINHYGQHIGVVVAETFEQARDAARLVRVTYAPEPPVLELAANLNRAYAPPEVNGNNPTDTRHGDIESGLREADVRIDATYTTPFEHHNPMEPHATTAHWQGDHLTLYNSTQYPSAARMVAARTLRIPEQNVQIVNPFMGGGFGSKVGTRSHAILAAIAARQTNRPVKLAVTREQLFTSVGHRTQTRQRMRLGAKQDGRLSAIAHEIIMHTSVFDEFAEQTGAITRMMYKSPNRLVTHRLVRLNLPTPTIMRAPGETPGSFALESAMDELAYALKIDPIQLRLRNEPARDPEKELPWSSRSLVECLQQGTARFGWNKRNPEPRSMRDGRYLIGYGVASATYPARYRPASARAQILPDGRVRVQIAATDLGTGTYTILTQIAADALSVSPDQVQVEIGDSSLPTAPPSGGSWGAASFGSAVREACMTVRAKLLALISQDPRSPLKGVRESNLAVHLGRISKQNSSVGETYQEVLTRNNLKGLTADVNTKPSAAAKKFSMHTFGAHFVEVRVDPDTGEVRVPRFVSVHAAGKILNPKTARSQIIGGVTMGVGMALHEETHVDSRYGNFVNHNLGEYHVPVNADINEIEAFFVEENDPHVNPLGGKGVGEIGIVGVAAAIANAVYHATGKRIRSLPITPDKLL